MIAEYEKNLKDSLEKQTKEQNTKFDEQTKQRNYEFNALKELIKESLDKNDQVINWINNTGQELHRDLIGRKSQQDNKK